MQDLAVLYPSIAKDGNRDRHLSRQQLEVLRRDAMAFRSLLQAIRRNRSAFVISLDGRYRECHLRNGITSKISESEMLGKRLRDVLPIETADYLLSKIRESHKSEKVTPVTYSITFKDGETRTYDGEIIPIPTEESVIVLCNRISVVV